MITTEEQFVKINLDAATVEWHGAEVVVTDYRGQGEVIGLAYTQIGALNCLLEWYR